MSQTTVTQAHRDALSKAKIHLMAKPDSAFFTTICFSLRHIWDSSVPTACTNGLEIRFNPDFFMGLDQEERAFLLIHESMHCAYLHMERLGERNRAKWNVAADHVINLQLIARGFKMPACGIADSQYANLSTEEVYQRLPDKQQQPFIDDLREPPSQADGTPADLQQQIQDILIRAQLQSQMAGDKPGTIPSELQIFLDQLLNPKLPWTTILRRYMKTFAKTDYSFRKPNRRFFPEHYLPSLSGTKLMDLVVAVDASSSVSDHDFNTMVSEVHSILKRIKPDRIQLMTFNTRITGVHTVKSALELLRLQFTGRGGTRIGPVLDWAKTNKPQCMLVFSDGEFDWEGWDQAPADTVWVIHNNPGFTAPFGKVIHYEV